MLIGFRLCGSSTCKKFLVNFSYTYNGVIVLQSQQIFRENFRREYVIYHSLFKKKLNHDVNANEKSTDVIKKFAKQELRISVIKPNDEEILMTMKDAQAYAKRLKMRLERDESSRSGREKYKLVKVSEPFINKVNSGDTKRIYFRQEIEVHDLNVKIRQCLRMVLKGHRVVCIVDSKEKNKLSIILKTFEQSDLSDYLVSNKSTTSGALLIFELTKKNRINNESKEELKGS